MKDIIKSSMRVMVLVFSLGCYTSSFSQTQLSPFADLRLRMNGNKVISDLTAGRGEFFSGVVPALRLGVRFHDDPNGRALSLSAGIESQLTNHEYSVNYLFGNGPILMSLEERHLQIGIFSRGSYRIQNSPFGFGLGLSYLYNVELNSTASLLGSGINDPVVDAKNIRVISDAQFELNIFPTIEYHLARKDRNFLKIYLSYEYGLNKESYMHFFQSLPSFRLANRSISLGVVWYPFG